MGAPKEWGDEVKLGGGDTIRDFDFTNPQFISCNYRSLRQPAKHVVSPPTPFLPHDNHPNTCAPMPYPPNCPVIRPNGSLGPIS